jgi:hypothetical protein
MEENEISLIERANAAAERMEKAAQVYEALLKRQEALAVEKMLGGSAQAGSPPPVEESDAEYAAKVLRNEIKTT